MTKTYAIAVGDGYDCEIKEVRDGGFTSRKEAAETLVRHLEADKKNLQRALTRARRWARGQ